MLKCNLLYHGVHGLEKHGNPKMLDEWWFAGINVNVKWAYARTLER